MFHRFLVFFKASSKFAFGFPDITLVTIFAWDTLVREPVWGIHSLSLIVSYFYVYEAYRMAARFASKSRASTANSKCRSLLHTFLVSLN